VNQQANIRQPECRYLAAMLENQKIRPAGIVGPLGTLLTLADLPPADTRWSPRRKAEVVAAVYGGLLPMDAACERYALSEEEFASWCRALDRSGLCGLRVTSTQHYRQIFGRT
jgi:hypothetical protein